jgi:hypothetical protein
MRLRDRLLILALDAGGELLYRANGHHLATDPACVHYAAPRPGSRLDRASRGHSCGRCMADRAFGRLPDGTIFTTWACVAGRHENCDRVCDCECHAETPDQTIGGA